MRPSIVVIGNFDGVHVGHRAVLTRARQTAQSRANEMGLSEPLPVIVVTFWPHPLTVLRPDRAPKLLCSLPDRIDLLRGAGASEVRVVQFTQEVADWTPEQFVDTILLPLNPTVVTVGANFSFGHLAAGTVETLRQLGAARFEVEVLDLVEVDDEQSGSTRIRDALTQGDVESAARHLGRPFRVRGVVIVGDQRGRQLGFPTANLPVSHDLAVPGDGVYAGWLTRMDDPTATRMPAAISVGTNPTFKGLERRVEGHVLDRDDLELYGIEVAVDFVARLRGMVTFSSVRELIEQMKDDVAQTRAILG